jgi:hypothetical protein
VSAFSSSLEGALQQRPELAHFQLSYLPSAQLLKILAEAYRPLCSEKLHALGNLLAHMFVSGQNWWLES